MGAGERGYAAAAALLFAAMVLLFWPGVAMFDSVNQYGQALSGHYVDWHPPIMARLWSLLLQLGPGQAPMFVLQALFYWLGLGLLAVTLAHGGARRAAMLALAIGAWPAFSGWEIAVIKDCQMASALLAAVGLLAWWRLRGSPVPFLAAAAAAVLIAYATLVRANAAFATAPLAVGLIGTWRWRQWPWRALGIAVLALAILGGSSVVNQRILGARPLGVERSLPIFDMANIAHRAGPSAVPALPATTWQRMEADRCASSLLWDSLAREGRCGYIQNGFDAQVKGATLFHAWTGAILAHPLAYGRHRLAHWNATMRWLVPWRLPLAIPQAASEPNGLGLQSPDRRVETWTQSGGWLADSPLGAPILWLGIAVAVLALARPSEGPAHRLAIPLALSTLGMEASFLLVSISSDWRYHLWSMLAAALAALLLATRPVPRRAAVVAMVALGLLFASCLAARLTLPPVGDSYSDAVKPA